MPEGAPSATGAEAAQATAPNSDQPTEAQVSKPQIKPIPPKAASTTPAGKEGKEKLSRPVLPGVIAREQGEEFIPKLRDKPAAAGPERDPATGQFKSREDAFEAELVGDRLKVTQPDEAAPEKEGEKPPLPEGEKPPEGKVKFLGKEYNSLADVEQVHRTLQGMHKKLIEERDYGYKAGHEWKKVADEQAARIQELEAKAGVKSTPSAAQPGAAAAQPGASAEDVSVDTVLQHLLSEIDPKSYEMIAFDEKGGLGEGAKYLVGETLRIVLDKILPAYRQELLSQVQPLLAKDANSALLQEHEATIQQMAALQTHSGQPAFPELADEAALTEIGQILGQAGVSLETMTQDNLLQAIATRRLLNSFEPPAAPQTPSTGVVAPGIAPVATPGAPASAAAAFVSADPGGAPRGQRSNLSPEAQRLMRALDNTSLVDRDLGFPRRRG